jgi:acyl-CoA synthetase (AMP-forming)/AMP-acid ligase II
VSMMKNSVSACFSSIFNDNKDRNAIVTSSDSLTYSDLQTCILERVSQLENLGLPPKATIVIALPRSIDYVVSLLACFWIGAIAFPLDPTDDPIRMMPSFELSRPAVVILNSASLPNYSRIAPVVLNIDSSIAGVHKLSEYLASPILVTTTSGSTGTPKAVLVEMSAITAGALWAQKYLSLSPLDVHLFKTSVNFTSVIRQVFWPLLTGGCIAIVDDNKTADIAWIADSLKLFGVTIASFFPSHLELVLKRSPTLGDKMRHVLLGGEPLTSVFAKRLLQIQDVKFHNVYGMTECNVALVHTVSNENYAESTLPIGYPIDGTVVELEPVAELTQNEVELSELILRSPLVASGYLDKSLNSDRFLPADEKIGLRGYRTGDLICGSPQGFRFVGRNDDRTKLRGFSIDLAGIEAALKEAPHVAEAAVAVRRNSTSDHRLEAFVVLKDGGLISSVEEEIKSNLPKPMIPTRYHVVKSLPRVSSGKIDREGLLKLYDQSLIEKHSKTTSCEGIAEEVRKVWFSLVGQSADFFEGGGHSLLAVALCTALTEVVGVEPSPEIVYEHSNLEDFVKAIEHLREASDV